MKKIDRELIKKYVAQGLRDSEVAKLLDCSPLSIQQIRTGELDLPIGRRLVRKERPEMWKNSKKLVKRTLDQHGYIIIDEVEDAKFVIACRTYQINNVRNGDNSLRRFFYHAKSIGNRKYSRKDLGYTSRKLIVYYYEEKRFEVLYRLFHKYPLLKKRTPFIHIIQPILMRNEVTTKASNGKKIVFNGFNLSLSSFMDMYPQLKERGSE